LWSPESPFLYEISLSTGADNKTERFGMRSFRFDTERGVALLNEEPYYLNGTNVCAYRFFEDPERGSLPWNAEWVARLHQRFKDMHWRIARYTIGFPPEHWYEVCDSLGFLIQDEFALSGGQIQPLKPAMLAEEFRRWMRDRWNHPCVVIWDANNESKTLATGEAIDMVRHLDLSNRPWENGFARPSSETDVIETHPYFFNKYMFKKPSADGYKKDLFTKIVRPMNDANQYSEQYQKEGKFFPNPILINEYGWLWLNRDGSPTTLTETVYETLWNSSKLTTDERFYIYARNFAALTEYWRAHRQACGVMHFCGLAYSRSENPRGQTSDNFSNIQTLEYEPNFYRYVRDAFAPICLMIDFWENTTKAGSTIEIPVYAVNDEKTPLDQTIILTLEKPDGEVVTTLEKPLKSAEYEAQIINFSLPIPTAEGNYLLRAGTLCEGEMIYSVRDISVSTK